MSSVLLFRFLVGVASTTYSVNCGKQHILDLDADEYGSFIALLSNSEVRTNDWHCRLAQSFRYPLIRRLHHELFLVVDARLGPTDNGHIFDTAGRRQLSFNAGDAIADVVVQADHIIIAYFDEGIGNDAPSRDGLAAFDFAGRQVFGYNSSQPFFMLECYCLTKQGTNAVLAYTYPDFHLLALNLTDYSVTHHPTRPEFQGAHALTVSHRNLVFYSSYEDKTGFFWWNRKETVRRFGHFSAPLRGIGNGKFLAVDATTFTIVDALHLMQEEHWQP